MSNFYERVRSERQLKAVTGLGQEKFDILLESFSESLKELSSENYQLNRPIRNRRPGGGRKGGLATAQDKLFFILFYLKTYPTFDILSYTFNLSLSKACENVNKLLPVLNHAQAKLKVQPLRELKKESDLESALEALNSSEESVGNIVSQVSKSLRLKLEALKARESGSSELDKEVKELPYNAQALNSPPEVLIDVTERTHFRHQKNQQQKKHYSGKKKTHTLKHTVISTSKRSVIFLGKAFPGSVHDYKMLKQELSPKKPWWSKIKACVDLGYQGIKTDYENPENISIPHKKPRKSKSNPKPILTSKQKRENKKVSKRRIFVEHTIGGMKSFHILSSRFRNRKKHIADEVAFLVAGLWNLKIGCNFNKL